MQVYNQPALAGLPADVLPPWLGAIRPESRAVGRAAACVVLGRIERPGIADYAAVGASHEASQ